MEIHNTYGCGKADFSGINGKYENMAFCLTELPVKHLYFVGHGNYKVGDKLRTVIKLYDGIVVSAKASDFFIMAATCPVISTMSQLPFVSTCISEVLTTPIP